MNVTKGSMFPSPTSGKLLPDSSKSMPGHFLELTRGIPLTASMVRCFCVIFVLLWTDVAVAVLSALDQKVLRKISEGYAELFGANLSSIEPQFRFYDKPSSTPFFVINWTQVEGPEPLEMQTWLKSISRLVVIIHGFKESADVEWMQEMAKILTADDETAVMLVDWHKGAQVKRPISFVKDYAQAASAVPLMGETLASFIGRILTTYKLSADQIECIGFSLGAQIGGYFTSNLMKGGIKIARFTALDAAAPLFLRQGILPNKKHVKFLEVVHTSASDGALTKDAEGLLGIDVDFGHVDFYPNGGRRQPGCPDFAPTGCHHRRAYELYLEAMSRGMCQLKGKRCGSVKQALKGDCESEVSEAFYIGMPAAYCENDTPCIFYVTTCTKPPYCCESSLENFIEV